MNVRAPLGRNGRERKKERWVSLRSTHPTGFRNLYLKALCFASISSMHIHAAVDADGLAGHEVAVVGGEEDYRADQIRWILIALEGAALSAVGQLLRTRDAFLVWAGDR